MGRIKMPPLEAKQILSYIAEKHRKVCFSLHRFRGDTSRACKDATFIGFRLSALVSLGARCGAELIDEAKFSLVLQQLLLCVDTNTIFKTFLVPHKKTFLIAQKSYYKIRTWQILRHKKSPKL